MGPRRRNSDVRAFAADCPLRHHRHLLLAGEAAPGPGQARRARLRPRDVVRAGAVRLIRLLPRRGLPTLKDMLRAELTRTALQLGLRPSDDDLRGVLGTFAELDLRPDLAAAVQVLADRGWQLFALTMGASESTRARLERALAHSGA